MIRVIQKVIFHLEAFVAKFMRIYERFVCLDVPLYKLQLFPLTLSNSYLMGMDF